MNAHSTVWLDRSASLDRAPFRSDVRIVFVLVKLIDIELVLLPVVFTRLHKSSDWPPTYKSSSFARRWQSSLNNVFLVSAPRQYFIMKITVRKPLRSYIFRSETFRFNWTFLVQSYKCQLICNQLKISIFRHCLYCLVFWLLFAKQSPWDHAGFRWMIHLKLPLPRSNTLFNGWKRKLQPILLTWWLASSIMKGQCWSRAF